MSAFILSANVARRHQSTGSRAMSTALVLADAGKREGGRWKRGSVVQDSDLPRDVWRVAMAQALLPNPVIAGSGRSDSLRLARFWITPPTSPSKSSPARSPSTRHTVRPSSAGLSDDDAEEVERRLLPMLIAAGGEQA